MSSGAQAASPVPPRRRPADRRESILAAAAVSFAQSGFHATHLSAIADAADISAPALYRHFPGKYELFAACLLQQARLVADAVTTTPRSSEPRTELRAVLASIAEVAFDHRATGNVYRREPHVLVDDDREQLDILVRAVRDRLAAILRSLRPDASERTVAILVSAALSIIASPVTHRVTLARRTALQTLVDAADTVVDLELPAPDTSRPAAGLTPLGRREAILTEAVHLFAVDGFHEVTVEAIGAAVALPPSGVYRHFPSKAAILVAALWRASERTTAAITTALASATTPDEALDGLAAQYTGLCIADPDIMTVYLRDMSALDAADQRALRRQQRLNVDEWASWLRRARPQLSAGAARFLVHAAVNVAADVTVSHRSSDTATVTPIVAAILHAQHLDGEVR